MIIVLILYATVVSARQSKYQRIGVVRGGATEVDEDLYSRQLLAFGREAQARLAKSRVLVVGCDGIGVEICKNLALAGVAELCVCDSEAIKEKDVEENCFLRRDDLGKPRGPTAAVRLAHLNAYCQVSSTSRIPENITDFNCVAISSGVAEIASLAKRCHDANIGFVLATADQKFGVRVGTDFGQDFVALNRESYGAASEPKLIDNIQVVDNGFRFELADGERHDAQIGDSVCVILPDEYNTKYTLNTLDVPSPTVLVTDKGTVNDNLLIDASINEGLIRIVTSPATSVYESPKLLLENLQNMIQTQRQTIPPPLSGVSGGVAAHEVLKCLAQGALGPPACFGEESWWQLHLDSMICENVTEQRIFVVGAGATGCELLKALAQLGVRNVIVADDDAIEISNLNRQFLFRKADVGRNKAQVAAERVLGPFKRTKGEANITAIPKRVDAASKNQFDEIIASSDCVFSCLDNVAARRFVDGLCLEHCKPLIDTGTLGARGSVQVVLPHLTETYSDAADPEDAEDPIALCTLKQHPYRADHVVLWAKECFEEQFTRRPERLRRFLAAYGDAGSVRRYFRGRALSEALEALEDVRLLLSGVKSCTAWARSLFEELFVHRIEALKLAHPKDSVDENDEPYWTGSRIWPREVDTEFPAAQEFIAAAARLRRMSLFPDSASEEDQILEPLISNDNENVIAALELEVARLVNRKSTLSGTTSLSFEKDDDEHLAFVTTGANVRAAIFGIPSVDPLRCKQIAGRVVPAVATTTAVVSALAALEFLKLVANAHSDAFRNAFVNLALPSRWTLAEPFPCESWSLPDGRTVDPWTPRPNLRLDHHTPLPQFIAHTLLPAVFPSGVPPGLRVASMLTKPKGDLVYLDALHRNDFRPARDVLLAVDNDEEREDMDSNAAKSKMLLPEFLDLDVTVAFEQPGEDSDLLEPDETLLPPVRLLLTTSS